MADVCGYCGFPVANVDAHVETCFDNPDVQERILLWMWSNATAEEKDGTVVMYAPTRLAYGERASRQRDIPSLSQLVNLMFDGWGEFVDWCGLTLTEQAARSVQTWKRKRAEEEAALLGGESVDWTDDDVLEGSDVLQGYKKTLGGYYIYDERGNVVGAHVLAERIALR